MATFIRLVTSSNERVSVNLDNVAWMVEAAGGLTEIMFIMASQVATNYPRADQFRPHVLLVKGTLEDIEAAWRDVGR